MSHVRSLAKIRRIRAPDIKLLELKRLFEKLLAIIAENDPVVWGDDGKLADLSALVERYQELFTVAYKSLREAIRTRNRIEHQQRNAAGPTPEEINRAIQTLWDAIRDLLRHVPPDVALDVLGRLCH